MSEKRIVLNAGQKAAMSRLEAFLRSPYSKVFILKGFAGTGKTTMIKTLVEYMNSHRLNFGLLASTGRAAKILGDATGTEAKTVHSEIYSFQGFNSDADKVGQTIQEYEPGLQLTIQFGLKHIEPDAPDVYVVDESSMISNTAVKDVVQSKFGDGRLLSDLFGYNPDAKFIFVGDPCQLPPVSGEPSPALSASYIRENFGFEVEESSLTEVMRQAGDSGILEASTKVREMWEKAPENAVGYFRNYWGKLPFRGVADLELVSGVDELERRYLHDISGGAYTEAAFICKSNTGCYGFSLKFREALGFKGPVQKGELLLVVQNNLISGLRNGDLVVVEKISPQTLRQAGLTFREIEVGELYTGRKFKQLMIDDLLYQPQPNLSSEQQSQLFFDFIIRMRRKGIEKKKNPERFLDMMRSDIYLNALRVSFGYALTCHKAQGGEWDKVYAYFPRNIMLNPIKQQYQWIYTAMTRAKEAFFVPDDIYIEGFYR